MVAWPPPVEVIYLSLLSKQPISVSCHPNGGFYLNKEKWPKSREAFKYRILPNFSPHSRNGISQTSPKYSDLGSNFWKILFLWGDEPWLEWPAEWFSKLTQIFLASTQWVGHRVVVYPTMHHHYITLGYWAELMVLQVLYNQASDTRPWLIVIKLENTVGIQGSPWCFTDHCT